MSDKLDKGGRPNILERDPRAMKTLTAAIHSGAFMEVAAQAAGFSLASFKRWMMQGKKDSEDAEGEELPDDQLTSYATFYRKVQSARAMARLTAEKAVHESNPLAWLRYGPGRERPGEPGWTQATQVEVTGKNGGPLAHMHVHADMSALSTEELDELERITAKCLPRNAGEDGES